MGNAKVIEDKTFFLHVINASTYEPMVENNWRNFEAHKRIIQNNTELKKIFTARIRTISKQLEILDDTLNYIKPKTRKTRGIHIIFGNKKEVDMTEINNALQKVITNEILTSRLASKINEQIEINNKMINRFRELEDKISGEINEMTEQINLNTKNINSIKSMIICEQNLHTLEYIMTSFSTSLRRNIRFD